MAQVFGDEAGVAGCLPEPGRRGVPKRVRGDVLLDPGAFRSAANDVRERRLLQPPTDESAEDRII